MLHHGNQSGIKNEMPVLSSGEEARLIEEFLTAVRRELTIIGRLDKDSSARIEAMRERVIVNPKLGGVHEVRYRSRHGGQYNLKLTVAEVIEKMDERALLLSYGPDPVELLVDRLKALGITEGEARQRAAGRVERLEDGRVVARGLYAGGPVPLAGREYTTAQLEELHSPNRAISVAARAILAESAAGPAVAIETDVERRQRDRSTVMGAF